MFTQLGKFQIKSLLGSGAMGEVYLGVDPSIGRQVAIKTILPHAAESAEMKERFAREAKAAGTLNHPNIVTVYEFGEDQGVLFIAMEYLPGHDLEQLISEQALTRREILEVLAQVCDGLDYAHQRQIVHRDIKPANVRVEREGKRLHTRVMDFGVARVGNSDMTATGMVMGTVSYMAPEYIQTGRPDARSDIFAVGVMLYEALSGRKPFAGDTAPTILYKIINQVPDPLELSHFEGISPALRQVLDRALDKDPDRRFQTADAFAKALRAAKDPAWQTSTEVPASAEGGPTVHLRPRPTASEAVVPPAKRSSSRLPWLIAMVLVALAASGVLVWRIVRRAPAPPTIASPTPPTDARPLGTSPVPRSPDSVEAPVPPTQPQAPTAPEEVGFPQSRQRPADRQKAPARPLRPLPPRRPQTVDAPLPPH